MSTVTERHAKTLPISQLETGDIFKISQYQLGMSRSGQKKRSNRPSPAFKIVRSEFTQARAVMVNELAAGWVHTKGAQPFSIRGSDLDIEVDFIGKMPE